MAGSVASGFSLLGQEGSFALGEWRGDLGGGYEWEDQQTQAGEGISSGLTRNRYDEYLQLRNDGFYLIDPRLLEASAGVNLDFFQEQDKATNPSESGTQNGTLIGYDFELHSPGGKAVQRNVPCRPRSERNQHPVWGPDE